MGISVAVIVTLIAVIIISWESKRDCVISSALFIVILIVSLFYMPVSVETGSDSLIIHRYLKSLQIPYDSISKAERCYPSSGGIRLLGSGGFLGYWGYFSDIMIGNYFGYFGDKTNCILVRIKNGKQYVIGCEDTRDMLEDIQSKIGER